MTPALLRGLTATIRLRILQIVLCDRPSSALVPGIMRVIIQRLETLVSGSNRLQELLFEGREDSRHRGYDAFVVLAETANSSSLDKP